MADPIDLSSPKAVAAAAFACLDLTELGDSATEEATLALVDKATNEHGSSAAVCIWPRFVAAARKRLGDASPLRIATVVNFPSGDLPVDEVILFHPGPLAVPRGQFLAERSLLLPTALATLQPPDGPVKLARTVGQGRTDADQPDLLALQCHGNTQ